MTEFLSTVLGWGLFAAFVACVVVASMLLGARNRASPDGSRSLPSVGTWVIGSFAVAILWLFVIFALSGFGLSHSGGGGAGGKLATAIMYGGPWAYLYASYRMVSRIRAASEAG